MRISPSLHSSSIALLSLGGLLIGLPAHAAETVVEVHNGDHRDHTVVRVDAPARHFGAKGEKAVSSDVGLSISNTKVSGVAGSSTIVVLRPALDFFVADSLSVGGFVGVEYASAPGGSSSSVSIGPRVGYDFTLTDRLTIWPKVGFAIARTSQTRQGAALPSGITVGADGDANTSVQLNLFVPVMFHPVPHFFLGLGPALDQDLTGDAKATTIALRLTIGGWI